MGTNEGRNKGRAGFGGGWDGKAKTWVGRRLSLFPCITSGVHSGIISSYSPHFSTWWEPLGYELDKLIWPGCLLYLLKSWAAFENN
jgi:hypothetical protein